MKVGYAYHVNSGAGLSFGISFGFMEGKFVGDRTNIFDGKIYGPLSLSGTGFSASVSYGAGTIQY